MNRMVKKLMVVLMSVFMVLGTVTTPVQAKNGASDTNGWGSRWGWWWPVQPTDPEPDPEPEPTEEPVVEEEEPVVTEEPIVEEEPVVTEEPVIEEEPVITEEPVIEEEPVAITYPEKDFEPVEINDTTVNVYAPEGALPEGTTLEVTEVSLEDVQAAVDAAADISGTVLAAVDITFYDVNGEKIEPTEGSEVKVSITAPEIAETEKVEIVHIPDEEEPETVDQVDEDETAEDEVAFVSDSFSIYAVVAEGDQSENARATFEFYNGENLVATMYVKNDDTPEEIAQILYDPGAGTLASTELFKGWTFNQDYGIADAAEGVAMSIEDLRAWAAEQTFTENETVKVYALIFNTYSVSFKDEDSVTIHSEALIFKEGTSVDYYINVPYTPKEQDEDFEGWNVISGSENVSGNAPYANETTVQISGNVVFGVNVPKGYWLSFMEMGGTYTPPQFIKSGEADSVTVKPDDPTRLGYTFAGWYENSDYSGSTFTFGGKIDKRTTLYAKWEPVEAANYTVIIWKEKAGDTYAENATEGKTRNYDFWESFTFRGNVGDTITAVSSATGSTTSDINGTYTNVRVQGTNIEDGTAVNEVISETGYHFAKRDENVTIKPEGTSVVNVYYDRHTVSYTFHYPYGYTYTVSTGDNDNNPEKYGIVNGNYARVYWRNGAFRTSNTNNGTVYNGTVYTRSNNQSWQTYAEEIGLYGESLNWPSDLNIWWYPNGNNNGTVSGTRMTYKADFIPLTDDMSVEYYGTTGSGDQTIRFYTQNVDGNGYTLAKEVSASNVGNFNVNDKFTGFHPSQTRSYTQGQYGGGSWSNWTNVGPLNPSTGIYGDGVPVNSILEIRFDRIYNTIVFMDGTYYHDQTPVEEENMGELRETDQYIFQADISSYNEGGTDYYVPESATEEYAFAGWYADKTCTTPYEFDEMTVTGVTVYAKWVQKQYRIFLHPNVSTTDTSFEWAQANQQTSFRVDYGEKISGGNTIQAERDGYELIGWYTDEGLKNAFNFDAYVMNDTNVKTAYDRTEPTERDKFGNPTDTINKDANENRTWITRKMDLYAKWRSTLPGANGINVEYDAVEGQGLVNGEVIHADANQYLDQAEANAFIAAVPTSAEKKFMYWVVQKYNTTGGYEDTAEHVYPGDTFVVQKAYAKAVIISEHVDEDGKTVIDEATYTVRLRAEYGDKEVETPTHITWYSNMKDLDQTGLTKDKFTHNDSAYADENKGFEDDKGWFVTDPNLQINQAVNIEPATLYSYPGLKFVGWARLNNESGYEGNADYTNITMDDLFLKWDEENGQFLAKDDQGEFTVAVTKVAADERHPYHDLYAMWEAQYFYIYHSSDQSVEKVSLVGIDTFDITDTVKEGFMYGGYYKDYARKGTYNGGETATQDGTNYNGGLGYWSSKNAWGSAKENGEGGIGTAMTPVAGHTYYLKEVSDMYLNNLLYIIYDTRNSNTVVKNYLITNVDDNNYLDIGLIAEHIETGERVKLSSAFTITNTFTGKTDKISAKKPYFDTTAGYIGVWNPTLATEDYNFASTYTTYDGVKVEGTWVKNVTLGDGRYYETFDDTAENSGYKTSNTANAYLMPQHAGHLSVR